MRLIYDVNHEPEIGRYKDVIVEDAGEQKFYFYDSQGTWALVTDPKEVNDRVKKGELTINVKDYGAKGDGVTDDTAAINLAISQNKKREIYFPSGTYITSSPIYLDQGVKIIGENYINTIILKKGTTVGEGSNLSRAGTRTDSYAKNAIIIVRHPDNAYAYDVTIQNISLQGEAFTIDYGIYAPRTSRLYIDSVEIRRCRYGFVTHDSWLTSMRRVTVSAETRAGLKGETRGWTSYTYGFKYEDDGSGNNTGTSLSMVDCWVLESHYGYYFDKLDYSTMTSCGADGISRNAYMFGYCTMTLNSCACENVLVVDNAAIRLQNGRVVLNAFQWVDIQGTADATTAGIKVTDQARLILTGCRLTDFTTVGSLRKLYITGSSRVNIVNTQLPTNGSADMVLDIGSTLDVNDGPDHTYSTQYTTTHTVRSSEEIVDIKAELDYLKNPINRTNLAYNPSLRTNTTQWLVRGGSGFNGTLTRETGLATPLADITTAARLTMNAAMVAGSYVRLRHEYVNGITSGKTYTVSAYVRSSFASPSRFSAVWSGGIEVAIETGALTPNVWRRVTAVLVAPAGVTQLRTEFGVYNTAVPNGATIDMTGLLIEETSGSRDYFDGATPATSQATYAWSGTANNSSSVRTTLYNDHGALTGLSDDDHSQYHNDARGDARYYTKSQVDTDVVHIAGTETITGNKTFSGNFAVGGNTPVAKQASTVDLGTVLSDAGFRTAGTNYTISTSGGVSVGNFSGTGGFRLGYGIRNANVTFSTSTPYLNMIDASAGPIAITLPSTNTTGYVFCIKKIDASANVVTVNGIIDGVTNPTLTAQWSSMTIVSTATAGVWYSV